MSGLRVLESWIMAAFRKRQLLDRFKTLVGEMKDAMAMSAIVTITLSKEQADALRPRTVLRTRADDPQPLPETRDVTPAAAFPFMTATRWTAPAIPFCNSGRSPFVLAA